MGKKKEVTINGVHYASITAAGIALNMPHSRIRAALADVKHSDCNYVKPNVPSARINKNSIPVMINGTWYNTMSSAAYTLNITYANIRSRIVSTSKEYINWRRASPRDKNKVAKCPVEVEVMRFVGSGSPVSVTIEDNIYASYTVAGAALDLSPALIRYRVLSESVKWSDWKLNKTRKSYL